MSKVTKLVQNIGNKKDTEFIITHGLKTIDVNVNLKRTIDGCFANCDVYVINSDEIKLVFTVPPKESEYRVVISEI